MLPTHMWCFSLTPVCSPGPVCAEIQTVVGPPVVNNMQRGVTMAYSLISAAYLMVAVTG